MSRCSFGSAGGSGFRDLIAMWASRGRSATSCGGTPGSSSRPTGTPRTGHGFAFEDDRARDLALVRAGWRVVRFTHAQIAFDAADVAAALRDLLGLGPFALA